MTEHKYTHIHFRQQMMFWGLAFAGLLAFVWLFKSILLPFILGVAVAYLLNPVVCRLGQAGYRRKVAVFIILFGFFVLVAAALAFIVPVLFHEIKGLVDDLPALINKMQAMASRYLARLQSVIGQDSNGPLSLMGQNSDAAVGAAKALLTGLKGGGTALTNFISVIVVMPIVAFFILLEWPKLTQWSTDLLPRQHMDTILDLLKKIDTKLAGFVRGQITVAVLLGVIYALALSVAGLKYGFLIGILSGLFSIIPMVGSTLGLLVSVIVAYLQSGDMMYVALIGGIFIAGQIIEGNFLTPKLVGNSVGLHPLWVFFALMAGGALFGIVGMLIAVPVAAVVSVIVGFLLEQYKKSPYYLGHAGAGTRNNGPDSTKKTKSSKSNKSNKSDKKSNKSKK